jgi:hypothetical protein
MVVVDVWHHEHIEVGDLITHTFCTGAVDLLSHIGNGAMQYYCSHILGCDPS